MTNRLCLISLFIACTLGCGTYSPSPTRSYNGTASVGDFLTISLDASSRTLTYRNLSNGDQGTVPYQVNRDGTYSLDDPAGNLIAAYEVPQYALLIQARKAGPGHDQPALITAVETGKISLATWAGRDFNYMQFRTSSGGMEVGSVSINSQGDVSVTGYWPFGSIGQSSAFNVADFPGSNFQPTLPAPSLSSLTRTAPTITYLAPRAAYSPSTHRMAPSSDSENPAAKISARRLPEITKQFITRKPALLPGPATSRPALLSWVMQTFSSAPAARRQFRMPTVLCWSQPRFGRWPTFPTSTAPPNCTIPATAFSPSVSLRPTFSRMCFSPLWIARFCSPASALPFPGASEILTTIFMEWD